MKIPMIVDEMLAVGRTALNLLRGDISDVTYGQIVEGKEYVSFTFIGNPYSLPLTNPDWVILNNGSESDKSIALRCLLDDVGQKFNKKIVKRKNRQS
jgi:hypothetical protein